MHLLAALVLTTVVLAEPKAPPRLAILPAGPVDLGSTGPRERREQAYLLRNTSAGPISVRVLDLAPGVTVRGPALQGPLAPGAEAALTLGFDPSGWQGFQERSVRFGTDDPGQGAYFLPVKVFIRPDLTVDGIRRDFGDRAVFESPEQVFTFVRETGQALALRIADALPPHLEGEVVCSGNRAELRFILRPERVEPGVRLGLDLVRVESNAPLQPAFELYLSWRIHHAVDAEPSRVVFQDPDQFALELRLAAHDGKPFLLVQAEVEGGGFQVEGLAPGAAGARVLTIRRTTHEAARAMLRLRFQGQDRDLRVPLAYLPATPAVRSSAQARQAGPQAPREPPPASR